MKYVGTIKGEFEETQSVEADNEDQAREMLAANSGETIDRTATGTLEVSDIHEVQ